MRKLKLPRGSAASGGSHHATGLPRRDQLRVGDDGDDVARGQNEGGGQVLRVGGDGVKGHHPTRLVGGEEDIAAGGGQARGRASWNGLGGLAAAGVGHAPCS